MNKKITRRVVLGSIIGALVASPLVFRAFRKGNSLVSDYEVKKKAYMDEITFPRKYEVKMGEQTKSLEEWNEIVPIHKRYWANYEKLHKVEFDYFHESYLPGGQKSKGFWDLDVHIKMEYGYGFEAKGKDSTGYPIDLRCTPDGCHIASARENAGVSNLMMSLFDAMWARPWMCEGYNSIKDRGVEMMPNPHIDGHGLYDVLVMYDDKEGTVEKLDYYSRETGMLELRYVKYPAGYPRGFYEADLSQLSETYFVRKYILVGALYLPSETLIHNKQSGYRSTTRYSNYTNLLTYSDT